MFWLGLVVGSLLGIFTHCFILSVGRYNKENEAYEEGYKNGYKDASDKYIKLP